MVALVTLINYTASLSFIYGLYTDNVTCFHYSDLLMEPYTMLIQMRHATLFVKRNYVSSLSYYLLLV